MYSYLVKLLVCVFKDVVPFKHYSLTPTVSIDGFKDANM